MSGNETKVEKEVTESVVEETVENVKEESKEVQSVEKVEKPKKKKNLGYDYIWTDKKRTIFGLPISLTRYILTETKFITRVGFFTIREDEIDLYRIIDKSFRQTLGQRMFGCGTVIVTSSDSDTSTKEVTSIKKPREFMQILEKYVDKQRTKYRVRGRDMIGFNVGYSDCDCDLDD